MELVVCTMFEGDYHNGVAALINSLYSKGFKGNFFAGYRGEKPAWASASTTNSYFDWKGSEVFEIAGDLKIFFLPLDTDFHFTNYKPYFMRDLWNGPAKNADGMFYFDPDIINICSWQFYSEWIEFGVALIHEIVWNDMPPNHPKRMKWMKVAAALGYNCNNSLNSYLNAGFIGLQKSQVGFIKLWIELTEYSIKNFKLDYTKFNQSGSDFGLFKVADQDLLNLTAMCTAEQLSEIGPEGMDFISGGWIMSHATGSPKPWNKKFLGLIIKGRIPKNIDKLYWQNCSYPIRLFSEGYISYKRMTMNISSFIGRFYKKN